MHIPLRVNIPRPFHLHWNFVDFAFLLEIADHMPQGILSLTRMPFHAAR